MKLVRRFCLFVERFFIEILSISLFVQLSHKMAVVTFYKFEEYGAHEGY